jgi:opacity protein-like surface antigen
MFKFIALSTTAVIALSGAALAADMPGDEPWGPVTTGYEGFFAGANVGYAQGTLSDRNTPQAFPDVSLTGEFVGGQAGYNFVLMDNVVFGIQGDLDWAQEKGTTGATTATLHLPDGSNIVNATVNDTITWTGAVTGRVGVTNGALMLYGLGGVAAAGNSLTSTGTDGLGGNQPVEADATQTHVGWTAGAGLSALMGPVEAFVEYRYSDYGSADYSTSTGSNALDLTDQSVRVGFNYHQH